MRRVRLVILGLVLFCSILIEGRCYNTLNRQQYDNPDTIRKLKTQIDESEPECGEVFDRSFSNKQQKELRNPTKRIFNGINVLPGQAPYQVRLTKQPTGIGHFCSGVIINKYTILTTARCASRGEREEIFAIVGDVNVKDEPDENSILEIESIEIHPGYSVDKKLSRPIAHDVAIIKTKEKMIFNITKTGEGSVNQICLPSKHLKLKETERMIVSGWGYTSENEHKATTLQRANVYSLRPEICKSTYENISSDDIICAKGVVETPCFGDWGAPLVRELNGRFELLGLFSFNRHSSDSACDDSPGVYTKVSSYLRWLDFDDE